MTSTAVSAVQSAVKAWPFARARRIGSTVYVGLQVCTLAEDGDASQRIGGETHHVFKSLIHELEQQGASMAQLAKLHTYYLYTGQGREVTDYWERMTAVRLQYLADPGPAATALRVKGLWAQSPLIGIDGIAHIQGKRSRIMPEHAWDWSIPTPFSQGWLIDNKVYVGGQISADREGKAVAPEQVRPQTVNTLSYIESVLQDAGADWKDVMSLKVAYQHGTDEKAAHETLDVILAEVNNVFPEHRPALVAFGVDLLYEGLLLEIDATAIKDQPRQALHPAGSQTWADAQYGFTPGWLVGNEIYVGGLSAPGAASLEAQAEATMTRIGLVLDAGGGGYEDLVKLNVYYTPDGSADGIAQMNAIVRVLDSFIRAENTVVSIVAIPGLRDPGQRIQIDGLAVLSQ